MVTDVDIIKAFAEEWGYKYNLTRTVEDFNNLIDNEFKGFYLFQAQGTINPNFVGEFTLNHVFEGKIFVCTPSDIDGVLIKEDGEFDKFNNVKKVISLIPWYFLNLFDCPGEAEIKTRNAKPFYNWQNINYDGVVFDYTITFKNIIPQQNEQELKNIIQNG